MQAIKPNPALSAANALEAMVEEVGGTYQLNTLVAHRDVGTHISLITFVNHGSPGSEQQWVMLNANAAVEGTVQLGHTTAVEFTTQSGDFDNTGAQTYVEFLLGNRDTKWFGAAAPYYAED